MLEFDTCQQKNHNCNAKKDFAMLAHLRIAVIDGRGLHWTPYSSRLVSEGHQVTASSCAGLPEGRQLVDRI
jgi:hypothetical protein